MSPAALELYPLQLGLKLLSFCSRNARFLALELYPLQLGLKLVEHRMNQCRSSRFRAISITTRIETHCLWTLLGNEPCFRAISITTRIETFTTCQCKTD